MTDTTTTNDRTADNDVMRSSATRRRFMLGGGVLAATALFTACSDDDDDTTSSGSGSTTTNGSGSTASGGPEADLDTAAFAASLEQLAVNTYTAAAAAATGGDLGTVPPAVVEFVTVALGHHQEALDTWNGVLTGAGRAEVTAPPSDLEATVNQQFSSVTDAAGAAQLALMLEQIASNTYLAAIPTLSGPDAITLAGQLQYVDQMHVAVLLFALGQYPVPEVFQSTSKAATPG
ncbi:MAG: ferritin-like domain-containing protein [Acidimicrobiia bacterium]